MKLLDKLKELIYEEDEEIKEEKVAKKIDVEKTSEIANAKQNEEEVELDVENEEDISIVSKRVEKKRKPVVFDDDDFVEEREFVKPYEKPQQKVEDKPLYGGYRDRNKEKFKPSPIISPIYGLVESREEIFSDGSSVSYERVYYEDTSKEVTFDTVRQKDFGVTSKVEKSKQDELEQKLLYEMDKDEVPGVDKLTLGDAEEYYNDLGLEYEVDYEDSLKKKTTRSSKNKVLSEKVDNDIEVEENKIIKETTNKEKVEAEEKNLFDLIDMMYDNKE